MKRILSFAIMLVATPCILAVQTKMNFDFDWKFTMSDRAEYFAETFGEEDWQHVQLPHDWNVKMEFDNQSQGGEAYIPESVGWYRKHFTLSAKEKDKCVSVLFDGIFHQSDVYINGHHLGFHPYGFTSIEYDLTPYLHDGADNVIAVRVNCTGGRPRWYAGAGIYRHAWLQVREKVHIATYGTYVTTPVIKQTQADVRVVTTVINASEKEQRVSVVQTLYDDGGKVVATTTSNTQSIVSKADVEQTLKVKSPKLWDINSPTLYTLKTEVRAGRRLSDTYTTTIGIRTVEFDADRGFLLNGRRVKLQGMCLHQDNGCLGTAVPDRAYERRLEIIKGYGCNAVRMSHNQPSAEFLDICDRLGILVIDEAFDKWKSGYYEKYFDQWWESDMQDMLLRDRNHPSVILWSIGNELSEAWRGTDEARGRAKMLSDFVHSFEPSRLTNLAAQNNHDTIFAGQVDVTGYNYLEARAMMEHKRFPNRRMLITEELPYYCGAEGNLRSYDTDNPWNIVAENDFIAGGFIWPGVDYWGEAEWPGKGWPAGLFDVCMHEKPRAAFHRAMWNSNPSVSIGVMDNAQDIENGRDLWQWPRMVSSWNFPQSYRGMVMEVRTTTNCEEVELWLNDKLMGRKRTADHPNHAIVWHVPYNPGKIEARGFNGTEQVCQHILVTTGKTQTLSLTPDRAEIKADGQDLSFIDVDLRDSDGHRVQNDDRRLTVTIEGEGRLRGIDSGDLRREHTIAANSIRAYFGRASITVQSTRRPGTMTIHAKMEGSDEEYTTQVISK